TNASAAPGTAGMTSPEATVWRSGTTRLALGVPPLSIRSQLYQPARPAPICAIQGQTASGGASIVTACVDGKRTTPLGGGREAGCERHNTSERAFAVPAPRRGRRARIEAPVDISVPN